MTVLLYVLAGVLLTILCPARRRRRLLGMRPLSALRRWYWRRQNRKAVRALAEWLSDRTGTVPPPVLIVAVTDPIQPPIAAIDVRDLPEDDEGIERKPDIVLSGRFGDDDQ